MAALETERVVATRGVLSTFGNEFLVECLRRHRTGDWGEVGREDWRANDAAVRHGERILSAYSLDGSRLWIITEADRSATTLLLPDEY